jgi:hypothetical protein
MQSNMYKFCQVDPIIFWKYTPGESLMMITASIENIELKNEIRNRLEARLCAIVLTANGATKAGKKPYDVEDFMPKAKSVSRTPEEIERMALDATVKMGGVVSRSI